MNKDIDRFVSTLAGAFRTFAIHRQDNKALDEIMDNLVHRFEDLNQTEPVCLTISNRAILFEKNPVGYRDITAHLASALTSLGFKDIIFQAPIQSRFFFQLLSTLNNKDTNQIKLEKLNPLIDDGEKKPIILVPLLSHSSVLRFPDEIIMKRLEALLIPKDQGGTGFLEVIQSREIFSLSDLFTVLTVTSNMLPLSLETFVKNLVDAVREGFFPYERFIRLFPLPANLRDQIQRLVHARPAQKRRVPILGQSFLPIQKSKATPSRGLTSWLVAYSQEEIVVRQQLKSMGVQQNAEEGLTLIQALLSADARSIKLGSLLLGSVLNQVTDVNLQEKSIQLAFDLWKQFKLREKDSDLSELLNVLQQCLAKKNSLAFLFQSLRQFNLESEEFQRQVPDLLSIGESLLPSLVELMDLEQDRGMRRKFIYFITALARRHGTKLLHDALPKASPFLLRNLAMILGDIRDVNAVDFMETLVKHNEKIVRLEAVRSLIKIGTEPASRILLLILQQSPDQGLKRLVVDWLVAQKKRDQIRTLIHLAQAQGLSSEWKKILFAAIAGLGGQEARQFLESCIKSVSFVDRLKPEKRDEISFINNLLSKLGL